MAGTVDGTGKKLLSRSAFPGDQHSGIAGGDLQGPKLHVVNFPADADDPHKALAVGDRREHRIQSDPHSVIDRGHGQLAGNQVGHDPKKGNQAVLPVQDIIPLLFCKGNQPDQTGNMTFQPDGAADFCQFPFFRIVQGVGGRIGADVFRTGFQQPGVDEIGIQIPHFFIGADLIRVPACSSDDFQAIIHDFCFDVQGCGDGLGHLLYRIPDKCQSHGTLLSRHPA